MSFFKELSYEEELIKLRLNDNLIRYYQENPEKREEIVNKLKSLRNKIVSDNEIRNFYKENFLEWIEKNIKRLENDKNLSILEFGIPLLTFLLGFETRDKLENFLEKYNREIALDVTQTIKEELGRKYGKRREV
ncbi:MAG: hypothetical protein QXS48_04330 [Candidatus Aenigmatarchaeota archaeon]